MTKETRDDLLKDLQKLLELLHNKHYILALTHVKQLIIKWKQEDKVI